MDGMTLLDMAKAAGLTVSAMGDKLIVRGNKAAEQVASKLLESKTEVMQELLAITNASLEDFRNSSFSIRIYSKTLGREVCFVGYDQAGKKLDSGAIYFTADELYHLIRQKTTPADLQCIANAKEVFGPKIKIIKIAEPY